MVTEYSSKPKKRFYEKQQKFQGAPLKLQETMSVPSGPMRTAFLDPFETPSRGVGIQMNEVLLSLTAELF